MNRVLVSIAPVPLLAGCLTVPQQTHKTQAQFEQERVTAVMHDTQSRVQACMEEIKKDGIYRKFHEEILFDGDTSPNKFILLANKDRYRSEQIDLIIAAVPLITKCRKVVIDGYQGTSFVTPMLKYYNRMDLLYIRMVRGELSISDANQEKSMIVGDLKIDWDNASRGLTSRLQEMHQAEVNGRRQAAAEMWTTLMQQQQNQQIQQQMLYQQHMQNLNSRPTLSSPTTTTCQNIFNQLVCTTR